MSKQDIIFYSPKKTVSGEIAFLYSFDYHLWRIYNSRPTQIMMRGILSSVSPNISHFHCTIRTRQIFLSTVNACITGENVADAWELGCLVYVAVLLITLTKSSLRAFRASTRNLGDMSALSTLDFIILIRAHKVWGWSVSKLTCLIFHDRYSIANIEHHNQRQCFYQYWRLCLLQSGKCSLRLLSNSKLQYRNCLSDLRHP